GCDSRAHACSFPHSASRVRARHHPCRSVAAEVVRPRKATLVASDRSDFVPRALVRAVAEATVRLAPSADIDDTMARVAAAATQLVPACDAASVTLVDRDVYRTAAASAPLASLVDAAQYATGQGPCLLAIQAETV